MIQLQDKLKDSLSVNCGLQAQVNEFKQQNEKLEKEKRELEDAMGELAIQKSEYQQRLSVTDNEMGARDTMIDNMMEKNKKLNHDCQMMQQRLMDEKMKLVEGWN